MADRKAKMAELIAKVPPQPIGRRWRPRMLPCLEPGASARGGWMFGWHLEYDAV